ncbi:alpha/beta hydrolase [Paenibacillus campi]|uniref:alpha/beta hydrolase n=1 Tax=Paenibacillus campi TaxID=3106031 RepID=UPI002AFFB124|nr:alpha/beta hydrolase [Paenibacillus sp. SGZ-1014]
MALDPEVQTMVDNFNRLRIPPMHTIHPKMMRIIEARMARKQVPHPTALYNVNKAKIKLPQRKLKLRIYTPTEVEPGTLQPAIVFYHGGGWVIGSLDSHDELCRRLALQSGCCVIAVDYRLAPEHPFPAAMQDAYDAFHYIVQHAEQWQLDASRIAVAGDSAGGNLATVVCLAAKDHHTVMPAAQLLFYPSTGKGEGTPSYTENGEGYILTAEMMSWFEQSYFTEAENTKQPYASPLLATDLSGMPPAIIITAQYDPLRDQGAQYAERLKESGNEVHYECYDGMIHGFASQLQLRRSVAAVRKASQQIGSWLRAKQ